MQDVTEFDPFRVRPLLGSTFSGGVAPGYYIDPLRGSMTSGPEGFFRACSAPPFPASGEKCASGEKNSTRLFLPAGKAKKSY